MMMCLLLLGVLLVQLCRLFRVCEGFRSVVLPVQILKRFFSWNRFFLDTERAVREKKHINRSKLFFGDLFQVERTVCKRFIVS